MHRRFACHSLHGILLLTLLLAGCAAPPGPAALAPTTEPPTPTLVAPTFTPVPPTATPLPPTDTPAPPTPKPTAPPTATPTLAPADAVPSTPPDPKADPLGALRYASAPGRVNSATFTMDMKVAAKAADDASGQASGPAAGQQQELAGSGAFEVVDAAANQVNTRMTMTVTAAGQTTTVETLALGDELWVCMPETGCLPGGNSSGNGVDPAQMLKLLRLASDPEWVDDKPLEGEQMHHLRYQVKPEDAPQLVSGLMRENWQNLVTEMTITVDMWLTAKDLVPRQMTETIGMIMAPPGAEAKIQWDMVMTIRYDNINQPVKIEAPVMPAP